MTTHPSDLERALADLQARVDKWHLNTDDAWVKVKLGTLRTVSSALRTVEEERERLSESEHAFIGAIRDELSAGQSIVCVVQPDGLGWSVYHAAASREILDQGPAINRLQKVAAAALVYFNHYLLDEAHDPSVCIEPQQHTRAVRLKDALEGLPEFRGTLSASVSSLGEGE